jgi:hypothetical protein
MRWPGHRLALALGAGVITIWFVAMALIVRSSALPPEASGPMLAVFEPGRTPEEIFAAIANAGGTPVRPTWLPFVWSVAGDEPGLAGRMVNNGAIGAYAELPFALTLGGCMTYADAKISEMFALRP